MLYRQSWWCLNGESLDHHDWQEHQSQIRFLRALFKSPFCQHGCTPWNSSREQHDHSCCLELFHNWISQWRFIAATKPTRLDIEFYHSLNSFEANDSRISRYLTWVKNGPLQRMDSLFRGIDRSFLLNFLHKFYGSEDPISDLPVSQTAIMAEKLDADGNLFECIHVKLPLIVRQFSIVSEPALELELFR